MVDAEHPDHVKLLEDWMKSYKAEELFDENGTLMPELAELAPKGNRRMGANLHTNPVRSLKDLHMLHFSSACGARSFAWCCKWSGYDGAWKIFKRCNKAE